MDEQNKSMNEQWGGPGPVPERGYTGEAGEGRRTSEIRSEIEQTRGEMQETIDAIEDRLRPRNVVSRAAEGVREATVGRIRQAASSAQEKLSPRNRTWNGESGNGFLDRVREHPIPAAIAATSLAWLAFSGRRRDEGMSNAIYGSTIGEPYIRETRISTDVDDEGHYDVGEGYDDDLESGRESMRARAGQAIERAQSLTSDAGARVRRTTREVQGSTRRLAYEHTMAAGAIAAAIGMAIGLALPETERENELLGETRDTMVGKAKDAARGAAQRVQNAAEQVGKVAGEAVAGTTGTTRGASENTRGTTDPTSQTPRT